MFQHTSPITRGYTLWASTPGTVMSTPRGLTLLSPSTRNSYIQHTVLYRTLNMNI